jgi:Cytochrome oxidase complex assembly protein 1
MAAPNPSLPGAVPQVAGPPMAVPHKSWLGRNWKWLLVVAFLGVIAFLVGIFALIMGGMRNSDVAKEAVARAQANPSVAEQLGARIDEGWLTSGSINVNAGGSGDADLAVPISGPKGKGTVYVTARKIGGTWNYSQMIAAIEGTGEKINLLAPSSATQPVAPAPMPSSAAGTGAAASAAETRPAPPPSSPIAVPPAAGQAGVIQTQEANEEGVVGELTECRRSEGVLTLKIRFRNTSNKAVNLTFDQWGSNSDQAKYYVTAGNKKYFMLTDADGQVLSTNTAFNNGMSVNLDPGKTFLWWAKYPAPPAEVRKIDVMMAVTPPFEDVPVTDN